MPISCHFGPMAADPSLPAVHALHLAALVRRWGISSAELFGPLGLREESLAEPDARLPIATVVVLVERARALTREPALGVHVGLQMRASVYGFLGFAAMSASTLREALALAIRFAPTVTDALALRLEADGDGAALVIEECADFSTARDVVVLALVLGLWQIGNALAGRELDGRVELALPLPDYAPRLAQLVPGAVPRARFGAPAHRMLLAAATLDAPLVMADPAALRLAREQCERALASLGAGDLVARVRAALPMGARGFRSLGEVAVALRVSPRTLKRRLAERGTAFSALLAEARRERALPLLRGGELSLEQVAERLGYSDVANFTRAFRQWTGTTPGAFRRARLRG